MKKAVLLILQMDDKVFFDEDRFIQNILKCIPNHITISLREIISEGENSCSISEDDIKKINEVFEKSKELVEDKHE